MSESLDSILANEEAPKVEAPVAEAPVETEKAAVERPDQEESIRKQHRRRELEAQGRDPETGQFLPKEGSEPKKVEENTQPKAEVKPEPKQEIKSETKPAEELTPKERAAFAKAADETRKRQALEARLRELEAKVTQQPQEQPKAFWDDPDAALKKQQEAIQNVALQTRIQTAEAIARSRYPDFDEKALKFQEMAQSDPWLVRQMMLSPDPADFAYKAAKNHLALQEVGDIDALREKIQKEAEIKIRAQLEAELKAKHEALEKERAALPGSLGNAPSKGPNKVVWGGPTSFDDILKGA